MVKVVIHLLFLTGFALHPFHISITDIEFDEEARSLEIAQKIFADDLESALSNQEGKKIDINDEAQKTYYDQLIARYLAQHLQIKVNGKDKEFMFLGTQREEDAIWCYIEISGIKKLKNLSVKNSILVDSFDDQMNLVHVKKDGKIRSMRLTGDKPSEKFDYE